MHVHMYQLEALFATMTVHYMQHLINSVVQYPKTTSIEGLNSMLGDVWYCVTYVVCTANRPVTCSWLFSRHISRIAPPDHY